ncbi:hypothetical protein CPC08DRAFT_649309, partial [Agrocybe pediades]
KDEVRVFTIVQEGKWHNVVKYNVEALLEGDMATSYTEADDLVVVASYFSPYESSPKHPPYILSAEKFSLHLGTFFVSKYIHIAKASVIIEQLRWKAVCRRSSAVVL